MILQRKKDSKWKINRLFYILALFCSVVSVEIIGTATGTLHGWAWFFGDESYLAPRKLVNAQITIGAIWIQDLQTRAV